MEFLYFVKGECIANRNPPCGLNQRKYYLIVKWSFSKLYDMQEQFQISSAT